MVNENKVRYNKFNHTFYKNLLNAGFNYNKRYYCAQALLDYLCDKYKINRILLKIEGQRIKVRRGEIHGSYNRAVETITIYNLTAVRRQVISINQFFDTLMHEFMHHYDFNVLKLKESIHNKYFYERINDLKAKLV